MGHFSVVSELMVTSAQVEGQDYGEFISDFVKLSYLLTAAESTHLDLPLPAAFVGVLDNHPRRRFNFDLLQAKIDNAGVQPEVKPLRHLLHR